jgi:hypothetical protein
MSNFKTEDFRQDFGRITRFLSLQYLAVETIFLPAGSGARDQGGNASASVRALSAVLLSYSDKT